MHKLLKPQSVAIVGASSTPGKVGNMLAKNLTSFGYAGEVYFVNHKADDIFGQKSYASLSDIGKEIDLVIIAIPHAYVESVIVASLGIAENFIVISAGFGETDDDGKKREESLHTLARKHNLTILGPNCLGIITPSVNLNASFAPGLPRDGKVAFISQSGALAVAVTDKAEEYGIGFSSVVSIGNKMHIDAAVLIEHFADDEDTEVIALYLESIKDGHAFLEAAARARKNGKIIILLKAGVSEAAQGAIALHTGSLAGDDDIISVALRKIGAIRVHDIGELFDTISMAVHFTPRVVGEEKLRIAIVTNAGGPGVISTDLIAEADTLTLASLSDSEAQTLKDQLPDAASVHNPIDILGDADIERYKHAIHHAKESNAVDVVYVLLTPQEQTPSREVAEYLREIVGPHTHGKPVFASFIGGDGVREARDIMRGSNVLSYDTPGQGIKALDYIAGRDDDVASVKSDEKYHSIDAVRGILSSASRDERKALYFDESAEIAAVYGINTSVFHDVTTNIYAELKVQYPCVLKVDDPHILHKSDRGGVIYPITNLEELLQARDTLLQAFPEKTVRIIAQPLLPVQQEVIIGMKRDATFGPVIIVGIGGIYTEIFNKKSLFLPPVSEIEIIKTLESGPLGFLFAGARGQEPFDAKEITEIVHGLIKLSYAEDQVSAIDVNPLLIYNDGTDAVAVDFKIVVT